MGNCTCKLPSFLCDSMPSLLLCSSHSVAFGRSLDCSCTQIAPLQPLPLDRVCLVITQETTQKNWIETLNHQGILHLAIFRVGILSMVTVGADMVDPCPMMGVCTGTVASYRSIESEVFFFHRSQGKKQRV